jgi:SAM-dependent methyltransferase
MHRLDWLSGFWYKSPADALFFLKHYAWVKAQTRRMMAGIDLQAFRAIGQRLEERKFNPLYLDLEDTMLASLYRVRRLGLDRQPRQTILDIGSGPGVFAYVCQVLGHRVVCTDIDKTPYYNEVTAFFGLDRRYWMVQRGVPAPDFGLKFDLITATNTGFNLNRDRESVPHLQLGRNWFIDEWAFFLDDTTRNLMAESGRLYLTINHLQRRRLKTDQDRNRKLLAYFAERGATFPSHSHVLFEDRQRLLQTVRDSVPEPAERQRSSA